MVCDRIMSALGVPLKKHDIYLVALYQFQ
uniref:Uncharacterized protein n=1 Tax=Rhizophora mucronata TaxID=61149 RepID=A0A2P2PPW6_RHIMU